MRFRGYTTRREEEPMKALVLEKIGKLSVRDFPIRGNGGTE
jgi:hypothetical protein